MSSGKSLVVFDESFLVEVKTSELFGALSGSDVYLTRNDVGANVTNFIRTASSAQLKKKGASSLYEYELVISFKPGSNYYNADINILKNSLGNDVVNKVGFAHLKTALVAKKDFSQYVGKTIVFQYDGGSNPGSKRVVKVESGDTYYVEGQDVLDENKFKRYTVTNIKGEVKIIS